MKGKSRPITREELEQLGPKFGTRFVVKPDGCWEWTAHMQHGYGIVSIGRLYYKAHRIAYALFRGQVPPDKVVDHICCNKACVNPEHLRLLSIAQNVMIGSGPAAMNARKTHCVRGHPLSGDNLMTNKVGRACRTCKQANDRKYRKLAKEMQQAG